MTTGKLPAKPLPSPERTLFFDFLPLKLQKIKGLNAHFHIYTVPGQAPYQDSRSLLLRGADGVIVVLDSHLNRAADNRHSIQELQNFLKAKGDTLDTLPIAFAYNKQDAANALGLEDMNTLYNPKKLPAFATIAYKGDNVMPCFSAVLQNVIASVKAVA